MGEHRFGYPALYIEFSHGYRSERGLSASKGVPLRVPLTGEVKRGLALAN